MNTAHEETLIDKYVPEEELVYVSLKWGCVGILLLLGLVSLSCLLFALVATRI